MDATFDPRATGHLVNTEQIETLGVFGPQVQILTPLTAEDTWPCLMRGAIPPRVTIPMHAHPDPETFYVVSGEAEGLAYPCDSPTWVRLAPGDLFHIPGGARHAWRNTARETVEMLIVSTAKMARFFREVGGPVQPASEQKPPSPEALQRFQEVSARYGYWNATPEENARVGIDLAFA
jgi:mannose-6-phosphate isomerase-like protein (cupin superfamily)